MKKSIRFTMLATLALTLLIGIGPNVLGDSHGSEHPAAAEKAPDCQKAEKAECQAACEKTKAEYKAQMAERMAERKKMMAEMQAQDAELQALLAKMDETKGKRQVAAMVDVIHAMAAQRQAMMKHAHQGMMGHGKGGDPHGCPFLKMMDGHHGAEGKAEAGCTGHKKAEKKTEGCQDAAAAGCSKTQQKKCSSGK